ncbi:hypothetical protein BJY04DRAFT_192983 [Aspergillus karnatakaensis]|uniref:putative JmjC domain protein n=1 Tax=Aspergillus karnatakaensis TaxID=1810916 RepID=UPI003CCCBFB8
MLGNPQLRSKWLSTAFRRYAQPRRYNSAPQYKSLETLDDASIKTFRERYFIPERPVLLPRRSFRDLPAYERWFRRLPMKPNVSRLNTDYLATHGAYAHVPLELTQSKPDTSDTIGHGHDSDLSFRKFHAPLSLFLQWIADAESQPQGLSHPMRLYLAQCQLLDLPQVLRDDFPTPQIVAQAGKGDIYDTNVWVGYPPTYTPLHRDPNPNLFVQLAGKKVVRLLAPRHGQGVFSLVRAQLGRSGTREAAAFRGEEMMQGQERILLERTVWGEQEPEEPESSHAGFEAELEDGDGLFIPKGWWHSIKGTGEGVTASVNWWFR